MPGRTEAERTEGRREPALRFARRAAWGIVPFGAFVVFGVYAAVDIRRNGWPRFGWRSKPRP